MTRRHPQSRYFFLFCYTVPYVEMKVSRSKSRASLALKADNTYILRPKDSWGFIEACIEAHWCVSDRVYLYSDTLNVEF